MYEYDKSYLLDRFNGQQKSRKRERESTFYHRLREGSFHSFLIFVFLHICRDSLAINSGYACCKTRRNYVA